MEKEYIYTVQRQDNGSIVDITSSMSFNVEEFIIVESVDKKLFVCQIIDKVPKKRFDAFICCYNIIKGIDLSDYVKEFKKREMKITLERKLKETLSNSLDADFLEIIETLSKTNETIKKLYEEYKSLC